MSLPRYAEYKESGVRWLGEVPAHWSIVPLGTLSTSIQTGPFGSQLHSEDYVDDETPVINPSNIQNGKLVADASCTVPVHIVERLSEHKLFTGDIVFARRGEMGRCAMVAAAEEGWICGTGSLNVRLGDKALPEFVSDFLGTPHVKELLKLESVGSTMDNLNTAILSHVQVPIPPLEEQYAIAAFVDRETGKIDALIAEQEKLLTLLAEKRQATISHAVTRGLNPNAPMKDSGVPWLGDVPEHWQVRTISSLSTKITNGFVGPTRDVLVDEGVRYLQSLHIKGNSIRFDSPYYVRQEWSEAHAKSILATGDVLIVQTGDIGQVAVVSDEFAGCNCHALIIVTPVCDVVAGEWLSWALNSDYGFHSLLSIQTGALHPHLNCGNVKNLFMPVPPIDDQSRIIAYLQERLHGFEDLSGEAERAITLLKERRSALIAAAVTGKIDVRQVA